MKKSALGMNRREFLQKAGVASIALASLPELGHSLATSASADDKQTNFRFVSNSNAATIAGVAHRMLMNGTGKVTPSQVVAAGSFVHINNAPPVPKPILASGTWKAKSLVSFNLIGTYGSIAAGEIKMQIDLIVESPAPAIVPATLKVVCNLAPAGLFTGEEEGFTLTIPGAPFGPFEPTTPPSGLSVFTTGVEQRN